MPKDYNKILELFFREAELGNWHYLTIEKMSKKLKIKETELKKIIPSKNHFLSFYNTYVDKEVIKSVTEEEIKLSSNDEIIQEYLMQKLEIMNKYKFGFLNILNISIKNPNFILINLKSNKNSLDSFISKVCSKKNNINRIILSKLLLATWFFAFDKWLYDDLDTDASLAIINKGISRIKKNTNLFEKI